jgi:Transposase DDE domain
MLYKDIKKGLETLHSFTRKADQSRFSKLCLLVYALIQKGKSSLSVLGTGFGDATDLASREKQAKRFLQSKYTDYKTFYFPFIQAFLAGLPNKSIILVIDGTDMGKNCASLMLSVVWGKRSIPLVWLVKEGQKGHFSVADHLALLTQVGDLLLPDWSVVLLGDGEFDAWELQAYAQSQGWEYALRTAKNTKIEDSKGDTYAIGECYPEAGANYVWIEDCLIHQSRKGLVNALVWHEKKYPHPLYLLSNLDWVKDVMDYYRRRFSIETLFGDIKSRGFNVHKTRIKSKEMIHNLLIVICLAYLLCFVIGLNQDQFKGFLAKIFRKDRMNQYSCFHIGLKIAQYCQEKNLSVGELFSIILKIA